jgi:Skp family chaperone for outer membrane proteins
MRYLLAALIISVPAAMTQAADIKVGVVDMEKVFQSYHRTVDLNAKMKVKEESFVEIAEAREKELKALEAHASKLAQDVVNPSPLFNEEALEKKRQEAQAAQKKFKTEVEKYKEYVKVERKKLLTNLQNDRDKLVEELDGKIKEYAQANGFDLLLDSSGKTSNRMATTVYFKDSLNVTDAIIAEVNKGQESAAAKPDDAEK